MPYAMSGTDMAHASTSDATLRRSAWYLPTRAMRCLVLIQRMAIPQLSAYARARRCPVLTQLSTHTV
eukprot:584466-Rhodomonas_salina.1